MPMHWMPLRVFVKGSKSDRKKAPFCRDLHRKSKPQLLCQYAKGGFKELPFRGSHPKHTVCTIGPVYHLYLPSWSMRFSRCPVGPSMKSSPVKHLEAER